MWYYAVKYKKKYTKYSPLLSSQKKAKEWYDKFGVNLVKKFNRKLELKRKER